MCGLIELLFGVVSVIGPGIGVLNGVAVLQGEVEGSWQVLRVVQPAHTVGKCMLRCGGSDVLFQNDFREDLL